MSAELNLLLFASADVPSGLALASRLTRHGGFSVAVTLCSEKAKRLEIQVRKSLEESQLEFPHGLEIRTWDGGEDALLRDLDGQNSLRVVLLPGLDRVDVERLQLVRKIHATIVWFEAHPGLESSPQAIWTLTPTDETSNSKHDLAWLAEHLAAYPKVIPLASDTIEDRDKYNELTHTAADWVLVPCDDRNVPASAKACKSYVEQAVGPVLLVRSECSWWQWVTERQLPSFVSKYIPQMERDQRRELSLQLEKYTQLDFEFLSLICASTFLAAFGLLQDSAAVIIGAMLVAPLMTPILGAGLSLAHGNRPLYGRSLKTIGLGFLAALGTSCLFGLLVRFAFPAILIERQGIIYLTNEMWSRTHPTGIDFLVGLVGGSAAAFARTRSHLADALAGAAIAAALVPPIATAGLHISLLGLSIGPADGRESVVNLIYGPILLFIANMLTIMIGSSFVLWACGIRADHGHTRKDKWTTRATLLLVMLTAMVLVWIVQHP
ncbi:MAG: DUF389 domain-containing protein [Pirellulaceae bacterium]